MILQQLGVQRGLASARAVLVAVILGRRTRGVKVYAPLRHQRRHLDFSKFRGRGTLRLLAVLL